MSISADKKELLYDQQNWHWLYETTVDFVDMLMNGYTENGVLQTIQNELVRLEHVHGPDTLDIVPAHLYGRLIFVPVDSNVYFITGTKTLSESGDTLVFMVHQGDEALVFAITRTSVDRKRFLGSMKPYLEGFRIQKVTTFCIEGKEDTGLDKWPGIKIHSSTVTVSSESNGKMIFIEIFSSINS